MRSFLYAFLQKDERLQLGFGISRHILAIGTGGVGLSSLATVI